ERVARDHVLEAGPNEGLALAGLDELMLDDGVGLSVEKHLEALLDVGRVGHVETSVGVRAHAGEVSLGWFGSLGGSGDAVSRQFSAPTSRSATTTSLGVTALASLSAVTFKVKLACGVVAMRRP